MAVKLASLALFAPLFCVACGTPAKPIAIEPTALLAPMIDAAPARPRHVELPADAPRKLIALDWSTVHPTTDADALAIWRTIAPNGADWSDKLAEIPADQPLAHTLALGFLHDGNFTCTPPGAHCAGVPIDVPAPIATAGLGDPCLRRLLALWSLAQLEPDDMPAVRAALIAIASIPPPESELVAAALHAVPEGDQDLRLALLAAAWTAGQHELVDGALGGLDEAHLITAATKIHSDGALAILSAEANRAVYLAAINDDAMPRAARLQAIADVTAAEDPLLPDSKAALVTAARGKDCAVAATAARILDQTGDHRFVPRRPHTHSPDQLMHAVCVLAAYSMLQRADEPSLLPGFLPARGLEIMITSYDPLAADAPDAGDGDPRWSHSTELRARNDAMIPELDDFIRATDHCIGTTCKSDSRTFKVTLTPSGGDLALGKIELTDRERCREPDAP